MWKKKILFIFENTTPCIEYLMYLNQVLKYSRHQVQVSTSTFQILERQVQVSTSTGKFKYKYKYSSTSTLLDPTLIFRGISIIVSIIEAIGRFSRSRMTCVTDYNSLFAAGRFRKTVVSIYACTSYLYLITSNDFYQTFLLHRNVCIHVWVLVFSTS